MSPNSCALASSKSSREADVGLLDAILSEAIGGPVGDASLAGGGGSNYWGNDPEWQKLDDVTKAAVMAYLEADNKNGKVDLGSATNALGAMINRADKEGVPLGQHVSGKIYQPTIEPAQRARVSQALQSPEVAQLRSLAQERMSGDRPDWVNGATHFLAPEQAMLALESREPNKYKNWGPRGQNWTGYDPATGEYRGVVLRDASHAFLAPGGAHSATFGAPQPQPPDGMDVATYQPLPTSIPAANPGMVAKAGGAPKPATFGGLAATAGQTEASDLSNLKSVLANANESQAKRESSVSASSGQGDSAAPMQMAPLGHADLTRILALLQSRGPLGTIGGA